MANALAGSYFRSHSKEPEMHRVEQTLIDSCFEPEAPQRHLASTDHSLNLPSWAESFLCG
jgi:hypothetical protein